MTKIKICGLTRKEDVECVNRLMPDYVGFVFAAGKRLLTPAQAAELTKVLDPGIQAVGVFVNEQPERVADIANTCGLAVVQLHGDEDHDYIHTLRNLTDAIIWKALRVRDASSLAAAAACEADLLLLDTYHPDSAGGTGQSFDWSLLHSLERPYFLAGGLTPENVEQALGLSPYGVDISSGVETEGRKDPDKIERFITTIRRCEQ